MSSNDRFQDYICLSFALYLCVLYFSYTKLQTVVSVGGAYSMKIKNIIENINRQQKNIDVINYLVVLCQQEFDTLQLWCVHGCVPALFALSLFCLCSILHFLSVFLLPVHLASVCSVIFPLQSSYTVHVCHSFPVFLSVCQTTLLPVRIVGKHCRRNHPLLAHLFLNPISVVHSLT